MKMMNDYGLLLLVLNDDDEMMKYDEMKKFYHLISKVFLDSLLPLLFFLSLMSEVYLLNDSLDHLSLKDSNGYDDFHAVNLKQ